MMNRTWKWYAGTALLAAALSSLGSAGPARGENSVGPTATPTAASPGGPATAPAIDPSAARILKNASAYLASCKHFSFHAEEWKDVVLPSGRKVQTTKTVEVQLSRPDKQHVEVRSARRSMGYWHRGTLLTVLDRVKGFYGAVETPQGLDEAIDFVMDRFGMEVPLQDLLMSDPYSGVMEGVVSGEDLGRVTVLGVPCRHLSFVGTQADWQVWIEEGTKPLVRKLVIDYRDRPESPQYTAILSGWDLVTPIADGSFEFDNAEGATRVEVLPVPTASSAEGTPTTRTAN